VLLRLCGNAVAVAPGKPARVIGKGVCRLDQKDALALARSVHLGSQREEGGDNGLGCIRASDEPVLEGHSEAPCPLDMDGDCPSSCDSSGASDTSAVGGPGITTRRVDVPVCASNVSIDGSSGAAFWRERPRTLDASDATAFQSDAKTRLDLLGPRLGIARLRVGGGAEYVGAQIVARNASCGLDHAAVMGGDRPAACQPLIDERGSHVGGSSQ
jgi:hypothetical protein